MKSTLLFRLFNIKVMNKFFKKLKNLLYYRTTNERLNDYVLTTVKPRFNSIRPKRKYKSAYSVIEEELD